MKEMHLTNVHRFALASQAGLKYATRPTKEKTHLDRVGLLKRAIGHLYPLWVFGPTYLTNTPSWEGDKGGGYSERAIGFEPTNVSLEG